LFRPLPRLLLRQLFRLLLRLRVRLLLRLLFRLRLRLLFRRWLLGFRLFGLILFWRLRGLLLRLLCRIGLLAAPPSRYSLRRFDPAYNYKRAADSGESDATGRQTRRPHRLARGYCAGPNPRRHPTSRSAARRDSSRSEARHVYHSDSGSGTSTSAHNRGGDS